MRYFANEPDLLIVGSGIAGLMTAYHAAREGISTVVVSQSPDPRLLNTARTLSSTFDGLDSRYVTLTEGHPYLGAEEYADAIYPNMQKAFQTPVSRGGWLAKEPADFQPLARRWLAERSKANQNAKATKNLFESYIRENRASMNLWYEFFAQRPEIMARVALNHQGILRIYDQPKVFETAKEFHHREGVLKHTWSPSQLTENLPAYSDGVTNGFIQGGALVMYGLTFKVQELCSYLLDKLDDLGVKTIFNRQIQRLKTREIQDGKTEVCGLLTAQGELLRARHYVLHPGAYSHAEILRQTPAHGKLAGVEGFWVRWSGLTPRDLESLGGLPVKVHGGITIIDGQPRPVVDLNINVTIHEDHSIDLLVGGGYSFVGSAQDADGFERSNVAENIAKEEIHRVLQAVYGEFYHRFGEARIETVAKGCVRSWTPDDRELDVNLTTDRGGLAMIHGGGNTGTTAKAMFIAHYIVEKIKTLQNEVTETQTLWQQLRYDLTKPSSGLRAREWQALEDRLTLSQISSA